MLSNKIIAIFGLYATAVAANGGYEDDAFDVKLIVREASSCAAPVTVTVIPDWCSAQSTPVTLPTTTAPSVPAATPTTPNSTPTTSPATAAPISSPATTPSSAVTSSPVTTHLTKTNTEVNTSTVKNTTTPATPTAPINAPSGAAVQYSGSSAIGVAAGLFLAHALLI